MAKIEIYETADDVQREAERKSLKTRFHRAETGLNLSLFPGALFTTAGIANVASEKTGLAKWIRESTWGKFTEKYTPIPKSVNQWFEKHGSTLNFSVGGAFLLLAGMSFWKLKQADDELKKLDREEKHVIMPDNLCECALSQIPIGSVELHKTPPEKLKSHTERLLQEVKTEQTQAL